MNIAELTELERNFWVQGEPFFKERLAPDAVMVFPEPTAVLTGDDILDSLANLPRWSDVEIEVLATQDRNDMATISYRVHARRGDHPAYIALCASIYIWDDDKWSLLHHQLTPVA
jgi:hypothetical protein